MRYKLFGASGLRISEACLGTYTFGDSSNGAHWKTPDIQECKKIFDCFANEGGNFIDTSDFYGDGDSEQIISEFIKHDRDHFVVGTKFSLSSSSSVSKSGNGRKNMMRCIDESLRRLSTDHVDIYWLHAFDMATPVDEIMRGFDDIVSSGKALYVGASNMAAWRISQANMLCHMRGWSPFIGIQIKYGLLDRAAEVDFFPMANEMRLGILAYGVLGDGVLSGKYADRSKKVHGRLRDFRIDEKFVEIEKALIEEASEIGVTPSQFALSFVARKNAVPIIGARTISQFRENVLFNKCEIPDDSYKKINDLTSTDLSTLSDDVILRKLLTSGFLDII